jgi:predicted Rossmann fold flavoprotein
MLDLCHASEKLIVMNKKGITMLKDIYDVSPAKIELIRHGVPDLPFGDTENYKRLLDMQGRKVILTFGLLSKNKGIEVIELKPALTPIYVENYPYKEASGISFKEIEVGIDEHKTKGDVLLTHKGFSGPAILRISEFAKPGEKITLSFIKGVKYPKTEGVSKSILNFLTEYLNLPKNFIKEILLKTDINEDDKTSSIAQGKIKALIDELKNMEFSISGTGGFSQAMVTAGGISLDELDLSTFELNKMKNVYAIGEVTDINGDTGGFNLQYAYSSAMVAAFSIDKL